jgi:drug/metabolite transporter (DMT)-like permease
MRPQKSLLEIHTAVFLFGLAGLFGKWLSLSPFIIVLGRVFFAGMALSVILLATGQSIKIKHRTPFWYFILLGFLLSFHWVCFFRSIQVSTVAVGLLSYSSFPLFTALFEPLFLSEKIEADKIIFAVVCFGGICLIVPQISLNNTVFQGVLWGVSAGLTFSFLSIFNRRLSQKHSSSLISFYQNFWATFFLLPFLFILSPSLEIQSILLLVVLGIFCTALAHTLFIKGMKFIPARTAAIISSLEPVYGIILALVLLKEVPSLRTLAGGLIILSTALVVTIKSVTGFSR